MSELIHQLPTLIGVVIGALASYLANSAAEQGRWRRTQAVRWDEKRAQAYAEYGYAVKEVFQICKRLCIARGLGGMTGLTPLDPEEGLPELARLEAERAAKWESVLLLGTPATVAAAREWHQHVWEMEAFAHGIRTDEAAWDALVDGADPVRARYYQAARRDLGISSGEALERESTN